MYLHKFIPIILPGSIRHFLKTRLQIYFAREDSPLVALLLVAQLTVSIHRCRRGWPERFRSRSGPCCAPCSAAGLRAQRALATERDDVLTEHPALSIKTIFAVQGVALRALLGVLLAVAACAFRCVLPLLIAALFAVADSFHLQAPCVAVAFLCVVSPAASAADHPRRCGAVHAHQYPFLHDALLSSNSSSRSACSGHSLRLCGRAFLRRRLLAFAWWHRGG